MARSIMFDGAFQTGYRGLRCGDALRDVWLPASLLHEVRWPAVPQLWMAASWLQTRVGRSLLSLPTPEVRRSIWPKSLSSSCFRLTSEAKTQSTMSDGRWTASTDAIPQHTPSRRNRLIDCRPRVDATTHDRRLAHDPHDALDAHGTPRLYAPLSPATRPAIGPRYKQSIRP